MLERALTLTDLTLFGVASIVGSGGFNLVGKAVRAGGAWWPVAFGISAALLLGASYAYSDAFRRFGKNTTESDMVASIFGPVGEGVSVISILLFNVVSISAILVFCTQMMIPNGSWSAQVGSALALLGGMAGFSLAGIELNSVTINAMAYVLIGLLTFLSGLGIYGLVAARGPAASVTGPPSGPPSSFITSLLLIFFVLAGFDSNMKFAEEAKEPTDIPTSFFTSNLISFALVAGVAMAIHVWLPNLGAAKEGNALSHLFAAFFGPGSMIPVMFLMVGFMLTATFVVFLSTTRYLFSLGEKFPILSPLKEVNAASVPYNTVALLTVISGLAILINHTETLVRLSDAGIILLLGLVAAAAAATDFGEGSLFSAALNGATATGFTGLLAACLL
jgi:amino acid transporter